jgi:type I restriction enzyme M protein
VENDLPAALGILQAWARSEQLEHAIASFVSKEEITENGNYNLAGDRYKVGVDHSNTKWPMVKIGDSFKIESGGTPSTTNPTFWDGNIPWVTLVDVSKSVSVIDSTARMITSAGLAGSSAKLLPKNTVIVSSRATIGRIAILGVPMATNQGFKNVIVDDDNSASFVAYALSRTVPDMIAMASGATFKEISKSNFANVQIPLPPLEVQERIVAELDGYAAIVSGARKIVENWKPRIEIDPSWEVKELGEVLALDYGKPLKQEDRVAGPYPVFGSNGRVGSHNEFLVKGPMIVVGRKGSAGAVTWSDLNGYPIDTTFYVSLVNPSAYNLKFVYFMLKGMKLDKVNVQSGVPGLNRNDAYKLPFAAPSLEIQNEIVDQFASEEAMVQSASDLIEIYEANAEAVIAKLWSE